MKRLTKEIKRIRLIAAIAVGVSALLLNLDVARAAYDGPITDAHAHMARDIDHDDLIALYEKADVSHAGIFVRFGNAERLRHRFPTNFLLFVDPYRGKRRNYRLSESRLDELSGLLNNKIAAGVGEFYVNLSFAPFNRSGIQTDLAASEQQSFLKKVNELGEILHIHDEVVGTATQNAFRNFPDIRFVLAHSGYLKPDRLRKLLLENNNLYADLSLISNRHFGPFNKAPPVALNPSEKWKSLLIDFSTRFLVASDIGANRERTRLLPAVIADYRVLLGHLPRAAAENIAFRNFERLFVGPELKSLQ